MSEPPTTQSTQRPKWRVRVVTIAALGVVGGGFLALGWRGLTDVRDALDGAQCKNSMKQIVMALHNYHDEYDCFPPAAVYGPDGRAWHSWRVLIIPHLGVHNPPRGYRFDEPWDSEHNLAFATENAGAVFHCPSDDADFDETSYLAITGDRAMWPAGGESGTIANVPDSLWRTLMVVEVSDSGVLWTEPRDLRLDEMTFAVNAKKGFGPRSGHNKCVEAGMADGACRCITSETPPEIVRSLAIRDDDGPRDEW
jgi:hypothetical protein